MERDETVLHYASPTPPPVSWWNDPRQGWKLALVVLVCTAGALVAGAVVVYISIATSPF